MSHNDHAARLRKMARDAGEGFDDDVFLPAGYASKIKSALLAGAEALERVKALEQELAEARKDSERLTYMIEQSNIGNGWLQDHVWDKAAKLCPMNWEEADDIQKWVRASIDKSVEEASCSR